MKETFFEVYRIENPMVTFYLDKDSNLFYSEVYNEYYSLQQMPWRLQQPFYFIFLNNQELEDKFKDVGVIGAIDLFIKWKFCLNEHLNLSAIDNAFA